MAYEAIVMGVSTGGMNAMKVVFSALPGSFSLPIIIVQHIAANSDTRWIDFLNNHSHLYIKEADEKEKIEKGKIYLAPANYHLLIESDKTFSLTISERVNFSRPSVDVLFESAAETYREKLIGIILTGANTDGTAGMKRIKQYGGLTIVQDPGTAQSRQMPASAISAVTVDHVLPLDELAGQLIKIAEC
ncbi:MAG: chemotaxis protein CheB [Ferruginibacter sp.]